MAERYAAPRAYFYEIVDLDDFSVSPLSYGGRSYLTEILSFEISKRKNLPDSGRMTLALTDEWERFTAYDQDDHAPRIVVITQFNATLGVDRVAGAFLAENVRPVHDAEGNVVIEISGLGVPSLLKKARVWKPIGDETTYATTLTATVAAPSTVTLTVGAPAGNGTMTVTSTAGMVVGDELHIELNNGGTHIANVTTIVDADDVQFTPKIPSNADSGNDVQIRKVVLPVASVTNFTIGMLLVVTKNVGTQTVRIKEIDALNVTIDEALTSAANSGNAVTGYDWSTPATDDVDQIIAHASPWDVVFTSGNGTLGGTAHAPVGESVLDLLMATAERTGEFWRYEMTAAAPLKRIQWYHAADGAFLTLVSPATQAAIVTADASTGNGIIHKIEIETVRNPVTRIYPFGGDGSITLEHVTSLGTTKAAVEGYTINLSTDFWRPDYLQQSAGVTAYGVLEETVTFGDITLSDKPTLTELQAASDALVFAAISYAGAQRERRFYRVDCLLHKQVYPGQAVTLNLDALDTTLDINEALHVHEVVEYLGRTPGVDEGVMMTRLLLSDDRGEPVSTTRAFINQLKTTQQIQRRGNGAGTAVLGRSGSGGGTGTGITDHGQLTGLTPDDDHTQYVKTTGAGLGLAYNAGIRGFDVELETNSGLTLAGGELSLGTPTTLTAATTNAVSGSGHTHDITSVSDGQTTPSTILNAGSAGELRLTRLRLNTGTGTNALDIDGSIKFQGTNNIQFSQAADATIQNTSFKISMVAADLTLDPGSGTAVIDGGLSLTSGAQSINAATGALTLSTGAGGVTVDPFNGLLSIDGDMAFTNASPDITTAVGTTLRLAPDTELLLDAAGDVVRVQANNALLRQGFSSGFLGTGWGIQYDGTADFRFLRADELHVMSFIADIARVSVGANYVTPSMAELAEEFTIPAVSNSTTITVHDVPGFEGFEAFANQDWVMVRMFNRSGGGLQAFLVWGQVSGYTDLTEMKQSWTFTTRSVNAAAVGQTVGAGAIVLDFGKSGNGWWWATAIGTDTPYSGITTWHGTGPHLEANRKHRARFGQLIGVTGNYEFGLQVGTSNTNRTIISDLRNDIIGSRLRLYANDQAELEVQEVELRFTYNTSSTLDVLPNGDVSQLQAESTGAAFWTQINSGYDTPGASTFVNNEPGRSGEVWIDMQNGPSFTTLNSVAYAVRYDGTGFSDDSCQLFIQVFKTDGKTPLTSEELVVNKTDNTGSGSGRIAFGFINTAAAVGEWNNMKVRLRWEYNISGATETIRLDPNTPSIAAGSPLPTGLTTGGPGFWTGWSSGLARMRVGKPDGARLEWDGLNLNIYNADNDKTIAFDSTGDGYISNVLTLGTDGGIWQGTGTFASPTSGLKIYRFGSVGVLETFNGGVTQVSLDSLGRLKAGSNKVILDADGISINATNTQTNPWDIISATTNRFSFENADGSVTYGYIAGGSTSSNPTLVLAAGDSNSYNVISLAGGTAGYSRWRSSGPIYIQPDADASGTLNYLYVTGHLRASHSLAVGDVIPANVGQIVTDLQGGTYNTLALTDTTDVNHGITSVVTTNQYAWLGKVSNTGGGLDLAGFTEGQVGMQFAAYATSVGTGSATTSPGGFTFYGLQKSGTNADLMGDTGNLVSFRNGAASVKTVVLIKGDGDIYTNGGSTSLTTFDDYDDLALVRAADLGAAGMLDATWAAFLNYNKHDLEAARLVEFNDDTDGVPFINTTRMQRLHSGALWQAAERIAKLEERIKQLEDAWQA